MTSQENSINVCKEKENLNHSYKELKIQVNQIVTFLQNQFGENFQGKTEKEMNELSNQIKCIQRQICPDFKEDQNESVNYKKFCDFIQKCQDNSHDDLSQEEIEISEIYNELLYYPAILNQIDITRHHRILSKSLALNKTTFNYERFIEFISKSIQNGRYETQSLLIYFDETDFSRFSKNLEEMKQQEIFDEHFLSYRNDRYLNLFDERFSEEQRHFEMKTQLEEILTIVHNFHNETFSIFKEMRNEIQERILKELKTDNEVLKSQLERIQKENCKLKKEIKNKIDEMIQRQQKHEEGIEEMKKLNCKLLEDIGTHLSNLNQAIQIEHDKTKESFQNELKTSLSKLQELSKLNELQHTQTNLLNQIQQIGNYFYHKCSFVSESKFNGILNYLQYNGQVQLTSGHQECDNSTKATNLIDYSNTSSTRYDAYAVKDTNWIEFNFLTRKIDLSSYQIQSYHGGSGGRHPKTWEIRGSNDQNHWDKLDRRENCSDLNGPDLIKHFICQSPTHKHYQYIRFYQFDSWYPNHSFNLNFSRLELYGDIYKT